MRPLSVSPDPAPGGPTATRALRAEAGPSEQFSLQSFRRSQIRIQKFIPYSQCNINTALSLSYIQTNEHSSPQSHVQTISIGKNLIYFIVHIRPKRLVVGECPRGGDGPSDDQRWRPPRADCRPCQRRAQVRPQVRYGHSQLGNCTIDPFFLQMFKPFS